MEGDAPSTFRTKRVRKHIELQPLTIPEEYRIRDKTEVRPRPPRKHYVLEPLDLDQFRVPPPVKPATTTTVTSVKVPDNPKKTSCPVRRQLASAFNKPKITYAARRTSVSRLLPRPIRSPLVSVTSPQGGEQLVTGADEDEFLRLERECISPRNIIHELQVSVANMDLKIRELQADSCKAKRLLQRLMDGRDVTNKENEPKNLLRKLNMTPKTKKALALYNDMRKESSVLCTPPPVDGSNRDDVPMSGRKSVSSKVHQQLRMLQETPKPWK